MYQKKVSELMIPVAKYPSVMEDETMFDAIVALKLANQTLAPNQKHKALQSGTG